MLMVKHKIQKQKYDILFKFQNNYWNRMIKARISQDSLDKKGKWGQK